MGRTQKIETHTFEHFADNRVSSAAQLINKLPNGWALLSLNHRTEYGVKSWVAVVQGPIEDVNN